MRIYFHYGCQKAHNRIGEIRKCAGRFVHLDEIRYKDVNIEGEAKPMVPEKGRTVAEWLQERGQNAGE